MDSANASTATWKCSSLAKNANGNGSSESFLQKMKRLFKSKDNSNKNKKMLYAPKDTIGNKSHKARNCGLLVLVVAFVASLVGSCIMWFTDIYLSSILEQMTIKPGSDIYEAWRRPPVRPLICVYAFNYTNIDEYRADEDSILRVKETGPYCYRETLEKTNITFHDNGTVTYGDRRRHKFEPTYSRGNLDDILIMPNLPLISVISLSSDMNYLAQLFMATLLDALSSKTMLRVKAHEFFFGYDDNFFALATGLAKFLHREVPFEKFGILAMRAAETKERITVRTGTNDLDRIGVVTGLNGESQLYAWDSPECNRIDGSDGAFFPRYLINKTSTLYLFHKDLCRRLPLVYQKDVDFQDGVMGMRYHVPHDVYDVHGTCYCKNDVCPPKGLFDVSPCNHGAPLLMSFPHFMNADPKIHEKIEGLHPDPIKHDFYIDIQPILGFTLGTVSRIQLNIRIQKAEGISMLDEFDDNMILPIVWFEVSADEMPPDLFKLIYHASFTVDVVQVCLKWGTLIATVISALCIILWLWRIKKSQVRKMRIIEEKILNNTVSDKKPVETVILRLTTV